LDQIGRQVRSRRGVAHRDGEHAAKELGPGHAGPVGRKCGRDRFADGRHGPLSVSDDGQSEVVEGVALVLENAAHDGRA
jgi:hypothetical protein